MCNSPSPSLLCKSCRISNQRKTTVSVVCFHLFGSCDHFASGFSCSMHYSGFTVEPCRCLVDKVTWTYEGPVLEISNSNLFLDC
ncbi:hypothetical protein RD792_018016 [Penstemon davidsonii]|uniref:Uncharacterized protein n=1 Tax=Penstemon davidsonii TaxID=160366 RepID=A0ABR0DWD4_9LAMI|nr:hypothetical protein RD792_018016 [Penstemon davidsonii]